MRNFAVPALTMALTWLSACGGGVTAPAINQAPVFTSASATSVVENVAGSIYQAAARDANRDAVTYSIVGGADARRFTISDSGQLSFVSPPNFDLASDADANNVYEVQIGASDGKDSSTLALSVTVTNSKEGVAVRRVATGLTNPVAIAPINDVAMLVAEKAGAIYLLNPETGSKTLLVQIADVGTVGVTALAVSPSFGADGTFVTMYTTPSGFLIINRYLRNPAGQTVPDNSGPLLAVSAPHYAGGDWLGYDASGALLAATSDAGGQGDPSAQDDASRLGKLLRIVPNPDPYAGASVQPLFMIFTIAKGFHQPNGGSEFGSSLLLADHGQDVAEEIDLVSSATGSNFGWPYREGSRPARDNAPAGLIDPVLEYFRSTGLRTGQAIVGGAIGPSGVASLRNKYIFADGSGAIFAIDASLLSAGTTRPADVLERRDADFAPDAGTITHPVAVSAGPGGTLYIVDADGEIFRVDGS